MMPPTGLQESLRKIHEKVTKEIAATEAAAKKDLEEAEETATGLEEKAEHAVEEGKKMIHREQHEERQLEKEAELTKGEETPGYLLGEIEKPLGEKDMGGWTMRVYTPEQQSRLHLDAEGNKVEPKAKKEASTQTTVEPLEDPAPTRLSKLQVMVNAMKDRVKELHPRVLVGVALGLFVLAFIAGQCRKKRSDALSGQYASITQELQPAGSHEQL